VQSESKSIDGSPFPRLETKGKGAAGSTSTYDVKTFRDCPRHRVKYDIYIGRVDFCNDRDTECPYDIPCPVKAAFLSLANRAAMYTPPNEAKIRGVL
jgi:hypothetical protein